MDNVIVDFSSYKRAIDGEYFLTQNDDLWVFGDDTLWSNNFKFHFSNLYPQAWRDIDIDYIHSYGISGLHWDAGLEVPYLSLVNARPDGDGSIRTRSFYRYTPDDHRYETYKLPDLQSPELVYGAPDDSFQNTGIGIEERTRSLLRIEHQLGFPFLVNSFSATILGQYGSLDWGYLDYNSSADIYLRNDHQSYHIDLDHGYDPYRIRQQLEQYLFDMGPSTFIEIELGRKANDAWIIDRDDDIERTAGYYEDGEVSLAIDSIAFSGENLNIQNYLPVGTIDLLGVPKEGETLAASQNFEDPNGVGSISWTWQYSWDLDSSEWIDLPGENSAELILTQEHVGSFVRSIASYTDDAGFSDVVQSSSYGPIENTDNPLEGLISFDGLPQQYSVITANGVLTDIDGLTSNSRHFLWEVSDGGNSQWSPLDANDSQYELTQSEVGRFVRVTISQEDDFGAIGYIVSSEFGPILNIDDEPLGSVLIEGTYEIGSTLNVAEDLFDLDGRDGEGIFEWERSIDGVSWDPLDGQSGLVVITESMRDDYIRAMYDYNDDFGNNHKIYAEPVHRSIGAEIKGLPYVGGFLDLSFDAPPGFQLSDVEWQYLANESNNSEFLPIDSALYQDYLPMPKDRGRSIRADFELYNADLDILYSSITEPVLIGGSSDALEVQTYHQKEALEQLSLQVEELESQLSIQQTMLTDLFERLDSKIEDLTFGLDEKLEIANTNIAFLSNDVARIGVNLESLHADSQIANVDLATLNSAMQLVNSQITDLGVVLSEEMAITDARLIELRTALDEVDFNLSELSSVREELQDLRVHLSSVEDIISDHLLSDVKALEVQLLEKGAFLEEKIDAVESVISNQSFSNERVDSLVVELNDLRLVVAGMEESLAETPTINQFSPNNSPYGSIGFYDEQNQLVGQTITVNTHEIGDEDGIDPSTFQYQWEVLQDDEWLALSTTDATDGDDSLLLTSALEGLNLRAKLSFVDGNGLTEVIASDSFSVDAPLLDAGPYQSVVTRTAEIAYRPGGSIHLPLIYDVSTSDENLSGLTLNLHYDSNRFTPFGEEYGVTGMIDAAIRTTADLDDVDNLDNNPATDRMVQLVWASFDNTFPYQDLPLQIATVSFESLEDPTTPIDSLTGSQINFTASATSAGYGFFPSTTILTPRGFDLDVDGDGEVTALGDGLMIIRKLFGPAFAGDKLTDKAFSAEATRTTTEIHDFIQDGINAGLLDVDQDGKTTPLGDGLMVIRHLFGPTFADAALTAKALSPDSIYASDERPWEAVAEHINALLI